MKKLTVIILFQVCWFNLFSQNNSTNLYLDIARSISTARGNADLYFTEGYWTKTVNSKKVIINFAENEANIKFAYSGGQLQDGGRIAFSPGIHIWVKVPSGGLSLRLDTIWFDDNGKVKDWKVEYDNKPANDPNQAPVVYEVFRLNDKSENLFNVKLLKNLNDAKKCDNNGTVVPGNRPLLTAVIIKKPNETEHGLAISFIPNSVVHFSAKNSTSFDNVIGLSTGNFEIRYLEYDILSKKLDCEIAQFDINVKSGMLETSDMLINLSSGSKMKFNRLKLYHDANRTEINGENGVLNVQVGSGTKISLNDSRRYKNELIFNNGEMNLFDFAYLVDEGKTVFDIGGGSTS